MTKIKIGDTVEVLYDSKLTSGNNGGFETGNKFKVCRIEPSDFHKGYTWLSDKVGNSIIDKYCRLFKETNWRKRMEQ